jgi:hypothetical protein
LILMEAPFSADPGGTAGAGPTTASEEETSGASPPHHTPVTAGALGLPAQGPAASCTQPARACAPGLGTPPPHPSARLCPPPGRTSASAWQAAAPGTWLADRWARAGLPCVRGPALSRRALHGGQATHATLDTPPMALVRRGGRRPQAAVDPAQRRATRARRRRRRPLRRPRAAGRAPRHHPNRPSHRPECGQQRASKAHRQGVAAGS